MNKIRSYVGFAIKSKSILMGQSQIKYYKKELFLILLSNDASENLINLASNVAKRHNCQVLQLNVKLEEITNTENVKIIGITNDNLANGIISEYAKINKLSDWSNNNEKKISFANNYRLITSGLYFRFHFRLSN